MYDQRKVVIYTALRVIINIARVNGAAAAIGFCQSYAGKIEKENPLIQTAFDDEIIINKHKQTMNSIN